MPRLLNLISRFRRDERGAFAVIFAVIAIVLVAMSGAVVDFTTVEQARTRAQVALDAAALALQPTIYTGSVSTAQSTIQGQAQALLVNRLADAATTWGNCNTNGSKAPCAYVGTPTIDTINGVLTLSATVKVPMNFVSLVGVTSIPSQIVSVATRKKLSLEVAMVLDNSGSMAYTMGYNKTLNPNPLNLATRMQTLQSAATCATNILFYGVSTCSASTTGLTAATNVKMGLVPFTEAVNVGAGNASASWIDRTGSGNITDNNLDNDDDSTNALAGTFDRISLINGMDDHSGNAMSWGGCVEARVSTYDTDDTAPSSGTPATLFTPYFAPDEPDSGSFSNNYISDTPVACNQTATCSTSASATATYTGSTTILVYSGTETVKKNSNGSTVSSKSITTTTTTGPVAGGTSVGATTSSSATITTSAGWTRTTSSMCSCSGTGTTAYGTFQTSGSVSKGTASNYTPVLADVVKANTPSGDTTTDHYTSATKEIDTQKMTAPATTTNSCQASYAPWVQGASGSSTNSGLTPLEMQQRMCKYTGAVMTSNPVSSSVFGPNGDCPAASIQPLTATPATVITAINAMAANGGTNITEGAAWGFRVLSPTAPFTEGGAYDAATSKVIILMTDGENTIYPGTNMNDDTYYSAYGYPINYRLLPSTSSTSDLQTDTKLEAVMNTRLTTVCTNAKTAGIMVYTIGVDVADTSNPTANTALLTNCATPTGSDGVVHYFFPNTATDLQNAFISIAGQLAALRLAQ